MTLPGGRRCRKMVRALAQTPTKINIFVRVTPWGRRFSKRITGTRDAQ